MSIHKAQVSQVGERSRQIFRADITMAVSGPADRANCGPRAYVTSHNMSISLEDQMKVHVYTHPG